MTSDPISKSEFEKLDGPRRINSSRSARFFLKLDLGTAAGVFGVGWSGEFVPPTIVEHTELWIAADSELAAIDQFSGRLLLLLSLPSPFQQILHFQDAVVVICDTDVIVLNNDKTIRKIANLGDVISKARREGSVVSVTTLENQTIELRI